MNEFIDLLEAQQERTCVPVPGFNVCADKQECPPDHPGCAVKLPARGASIVIPPDDFRALVTELQTACRELGPRCTYETKALLERIGAAP